MFVCFLHPYGIPRNSTSNPEYIMGSKTSSRKGSIGRQIISRTKTNETQNEEEEDENEDEEDQQEIFQKDDSFDEASDLKDNMGRGHLQNIRIFNMEGIFFVNICLNIILF